MYKNKYFKYLTKIRLLGGRPSDDDVIIAAAAENKAPIVPGLCETNLKSFDISTIFTAQVANLQRYTYQIPPKTPSDSPETVEIVYFDRLLVNRDKWFIKSKMIGQGSYGIVILYVYTNPNNETHALAIKFGDIDNDIAILTYIKERNICGSGYVNSTVAAFRYEIPPATPAAPAAQKIYATKSYIVMEYMNGTLYDFYRGYNRSVPFNTIKIIFMNLISQFYCFSRYNLFYTDIKPENVLYKCNNGVFEFFLGDIGGMVDSNTNKRGIASFPPPERCANINVHTLSCGEFRAADEKDVVWSFAIMILKLIGISSEQYHFSNIKKLVSEGTVYSSTATDLNIAKNKLNSQIVAKDSLNVEPGHINLSVNYFIDLLKAMLHLDKQQRIGLKELYERAQSQVMA